MRLSGSWGALALTLVLFTAGCVTVDPTSAADEAAAAVPRVVAHEDCTLQIGFFGVSWAAAEERMPNGFEPAVDANDPTGTDAAAFAVAYDCAAALVDGLPVAENVTEMGFALGVVPPEEYASDASGHWLVTWLTTSDAVAGAYDAWSLGGPGDAPVTERTTLPPVYREMRTLMTGPEATGDLMVGAANENRDVGEDHLRLFTAVDGELAHVIDLVVAPTRQDLGPTTFTSDGTGFLPLEEGRGIGGIESWDGQAWTFTRVPAPGEAEAL